MSPAETELGPATRAATGKGGLDKVVASGKPLTSDEAAVSAQFSKSQKCWAHLLRKAIKRTRQDTDNEVYRAFTDRLLEIYRQACRVQRDGRPGDTGRAGKVVALEKELCELCAPMWFAVT